MADHNNYLWYKFGERYLISWITGSATEIIKKFPSEDQELVSDTGEVTLAKLKSRSKLIAKHVDPIPNAIFQLFLSIIEARKKTHDTFVRSSEGNPHPGIHQRNDSHQRWIEGLSEAFWLLGGYEWQDKSKLSSSVPDLSKETAIANIFSLLDVEGETTDGTDGQETINDDKYECTSVAEVDKKQSYKKPKQKSKKKTKKKRGRREKAKAHNSNAAISGAQGPTKRSI